VPHTLLLADDSATIQRVIELTFAEEDIRVVAVSDGDQAIAALESAPPDIVLADVGMPGKNGYEVAEYVKRNPRLAHIPVVLLTGAFEPVDQAKATAAGCDGVLAKPFEPQIVIGRVRELLGRSASASADGIQPASGRQVPAQASPFDAFLPAAPAADAAPAPPVFEAHVEVAPEARVEDYFDRLDAAFANLSNAPAAPAEPPPPVPPELDWLRPKIAAPPAEPDPEPVFEAVPEPESAPVFDPVFEPVLELAPEPVPEPEPEPVVEIAPPPPPAPLVAAFEPREPEPREPGELREPREPGEPRAPRSLPSIADAFGAILAAEQNALGVRPEWPSPASQPAVAASAPAAPSEIVITDDLVDRVARRVLEQLSDRIVRETVTSLASETAERLVREEIERIKASVK